MTRRTDRDEIQEAIELLSKRLDRIRLDIQRQKEGGDPRLLGLFKGEVSEVIADLERYRVETAAAIAKANAGYAVSHAYLTVGKLASPGSAEILSFDKNRNKSHARRSKH